MWSFLIALVSRAEHLRRKVFVSALETLKKVDQTLSDTMEVCSFIIVSLGIVQNSLLDSLNYFMY